MDISDLSDVNIGSTDGYNISYGSQEETLELLGGQHLNETIDKEVETANHFTIKTNKGTMYHFADGTKTKINDIVYKSPKLIG